MYKFSKNPNVIVDGVKYRHVHLPLRMPLPRPVPQGAVGPAVGTPGALVQDNRGKNAVHDFLVDDIVGINGDEYRVLRVMPNGVLASWERCADHTQVLSSKDIEIASMLGVLSVRRGSDHPEGRLDGPALGNQGMKSARSRKKDGVR